MKKNLQNLSSDDYQVVLDNIADGVFVIDKNGVIIAVNKAVESNGGKKMDEVVGKTILELEEEGYCTEFISKKVIQTGKTETALQRTKDNRELLVTGNPYFDSSGELKMVIACERDITELHQIKTNLLKIKSINRRYKSELDRLREINEKNNKVIFVSSKMKEAAAVARKAALTDVTILIQGDSGTGKEVMANLIYSSSMRNDKPFVKVNCGAIPESLMESELFGYVKGAFTGANKEGKLGYFRMANGGTILLDEVSEIPLNLQVKLLRAIQEREIVPVGSDKPVKLDIRIIAATNRSLKNMIKEGKFRRDLYYRLSVVTIFIPALKDRKEDILLLTKHFIDTFNEKYGLNIEFTSKAQRSLLNFNWPGNVRELENFIESMIVTSEEDLINENDVIRQLELIREKDAGFDENTDWRSDLNNNDIMITGSLTQMVEKYEKNILENLYYQYGDTSQMAEALNISRSTINRKLVRYGIR